ncbi:hypothetical protein K450DRAFT_236959 [Umbelopsis ramanniana AG]|uniref:Arrestin-like N-terminal domain-containing protein n=1 Tax=Umbelopsis ramanniana AG TaxID=1314678 RepID=A0AAD5HEU3_UMBRA|nr:uncharacterized protein K450DRAFT_236959 [Umbelopsis ramanniana AG]KAI8580424.1 hypothetical protein K450DRAFT_236959 [Umbelopsis ramanniana AG]
MICPITSVSLSPNTTNIDLFSEQGVLNATSHSLAGTVTVRLSSHTVIRAIFIKLKGVSRSVHQRNPERLRMTDTHAMFVLCKEKMSLLDSPKPFNAGEHTFSWTLSFPCDGLPPTINLPQHQIAYSISVRVVADGYLRRPSLCTSLPVTINRHSLGALHLASYIPNIRYRGQRADKIRYEFELPKMACMQLGRFDFSGKLVSFLEGCRAVKIAVRLDQIETYSLGQAILGLEKPSFKQTASDGIISHVTQIGQTEFNIERSNSLTQFLSLHLMLTSPLVSPTLKSKALDISHRLRLRLYFESEKEMALSFPLVISTAPAQEPLSSPPSSPISLNEEGWLRGLISEYDDGVYPVSAEQLPSYDDVLSEGLPPLVFMDSLTTPLYT